MGLLAPGSRSFVQAGVVAVLLLTACGDPLLAITPAWKDLPGPLALRCTASTECAPHTVCLHSRCLECGTSAAQCAGDLTRLSCTDEGAQVTELETCSTACSAGGCRTANSCKVDSICGEAPWATTCCRADVVPGGIFDMYYRSSADAASPVSNTVQRTVAAFALDRFEVTISRFRRFLALYNSELQPQQDEGAQPGRPDSGWQAEWNENPAWVPYSQDGLTKMFASMPSLPDQFHGLDELLPVRGVNWFVALAFCIWDGGRLPTEAEWAYAAQGGGDRVVPWAASAAEEAIDLEHAQFGTHGGSPSPVGSKHAGAGMYGHEDLSGNLNEWLFDAYVDRPEKAPCPVRIDGQTLEDPACTVVESAALRVVRGGSYADTEQELVNGYRAKRRPEQGHSAIGFRCARDLDTVK